MASGKRLFSIVRSLGLIGASRYIGVRLLELAGYRKAKCADRCAELVDGKAGIEIGGPSAGFGRSGALPLYCFAARMDNCNYSAETVWEGRICYEMPFTPEPDSCVGVQYVREATDLSGIEDQSYDFLCSSHALEHVANPLKAIEEWKRVLRPGGVLVLVLPIKDATFDHRRPVTTLEHLIADYQNGVGEDDLTHLDEILQLHDLALDAGISDFEAFRQRSLDNKANRCLHHHVFDEHLVAQIAEHAGLQTIAQETLHPYGTILIGRV